MLLRFKSGSEDFGLVHKVQKCARWEGHKMPRGGHKGYCKGFKGVSVQGDEGGNALETTLLGNRTTAESNISC
jgi:hypothetical protein